MGGQLSSPASSSSISSSSSACSPSSNSSPSPGLSSLGSNGQQSARCRSSSPPTQSASQSSLALSSLSANSSSALGRHSSALIRPLGALHSQPASSPTAFGQSRFLISPPMFRRNNQPKEVPIGGAKALSRWGSFTKALPSLVRGNSTAGNHHAKQKEQKRQQQQMQGMGAGGPMRKVGAGAMVDPNNNRNDYNNAASFYEQRSPPWSEDEREGEGGRHQQDFSLKQSLKKSGSRLFNGILKGGYIRALLGDDEAERENDESGDEGEAEGQMNGSREIGHQDLLNNNSGIGPFDQSGAVPTKSTARLRPSSTSFFHGQNAPPKSSIGTSALRSSLRQAKRHFLLPSHHQSNANCQGGNGLVSSMLLAMAAGQPIPPLHSSVARPFSCPTNDSGQQMVDWNGNNARNLTANGQRKKIIQASSSELIRALGHFVGQNCRPGLLGQFDPSQLSTWLRGVDRALILQGWQDSPFINPANLVFLFLLIRDTFAQGDCQRLNSLRELHSFVLLCLYISYSYMGNEISYPLKPFITENTNRTLFWSQCVRLIKQHSGQMLRLNSSSTFFLEVFTELRAYCPEYLTQSKASYY